MNWRNNARAVRTRICACGTSSSGELDTKGVQRILDAAELKKRTLTNLYNARPTWLAMAHAALDAAVCAAYGWPTDMSDEQILERLLALNLERAGRG